MTNFIQPVYTLHTPRGSNQSPQYERIPSTQTQNFDAFGRQKANTFEYKIVYPGGKRGGQTGFSNIRPTTVTPAQNRLTGQHLYQSTNRLDPRVDNTKVNAYKSIRRGNCRRCIDSFCVICIEAVKCRYYHIVIHSQHKSEPLQIIYHTFTRVHQKKQ